MSDHDHGGHDHTSGHDHEHHSHGPLYFTIFVGLCFCTAISWVLDLYSFLLPSRAVLVGAVMAVAVTKALCVMMIFMHLKFERAWKYLLLAPTVILACTIPFALAPDVGFHYYAIDTVQGAEYERLDAEGRTPGLRHEEHGSAGHGAAGEHGTEKPAHH